MSIESAPEGEVSARADLAGAVFWAVLGAAIAIGSWRMDRLENLHINKYEVPGLVPGLLGLAIFVLGLMLGARALRGGTLQPAAGTAPAARNGAWLRTAGVFAAMVCYSVVLVGHGLPFWLATAGFVGLFIFVVDRERQAAQGRSTARQAVFAAVCGIATSAVVTLVFQNVFYVRLP